MRKCRTNDHNPNGVIIKRVILKEKTSVHGVEHLYLESELQELCSD